MHHKNAIKMSDQKHKIALYTHHKTIFTKKRARKIFPPLSVRYITNIVHSTYIESLYVKLQTQKNIFISHENEFMSKHKIYFFIYEYVHNFVLGFSAFFSPRPPIGKCAHNKKIIKFQYHENEWNVRLRPLRKL